MSISAIGQGLWQSASTALTTPKAQTASFNFSSSVKSAHRHEATDKTQSGGNPTPLTPLQESGQTSGAFATDMMQALKAYGAAAKDKP